MTYQLTTIKEWCCSSSLFWKFISEHTLKNIDVGKFPKKWIALMTLIYCWSKKHSHINIVYNTLEIVLQIMEFFISLKMKRWMIVLYIISIHSIHTPALATIAISFYFSCHLFVRRVHISEMRGWDTFLRRQFAILVLNVWYYLPDLLWTNFS